VEGTIHWISLKAVTKYLGIFNPEKKQFKFQEYEVNKPLCIDLVKAIKGKEEVELPVNYISVVNDTHINGKVLGKGSKEVAEFPLQFIGVVSKHDGFLELATKGINLQLYCRGPTKGSTI